MDDHCVVQHGIMVCEKCEYRAEDKGIMESHMKYHTGKTVHTCFICEFEATRQSILEDHMDHQCEHCEQTFKHLFVKRYHSCKQVSKYACSTCSFMSVSLDEHLTHIEKTHINPYNKDIWKCDRCDFVTSAVDNLTSHKQASHKTMKVDVKLKEQIVLACDQCDYKCH